MFAKSPNAAMHMKRLIESRSTRAIQIIRAKACSSCIIVGVAKMGRRDA